MAAYIDIHSHSLGSSDPDVFKINSVSLKDIVHLDLKPQDLIHPFTVGVHPWHVEMSQSKNAPEILESFLTQDLCVGVGEIGLDRARKESYSLQQQVFTAQLRWAMEREQDFLVVHCVRTQNEILKTVKDLKFKGRILFHDYNGTDSEWRMLADKGYIVGLGAKILNPKTKAHRLIRSLTADHEKIPWGQFFLETDDGAVDIKELYIFLSQISQIPVDEIRKNFAQNMPSKLGI